MRKRVPAYPDSPAFQQLWDALGSKLIEAAQGQLPSKQAVVGSSPISRSTDSLLALLQAIGTGQGSLPDENRPKRHSLSLSRSVSYQREEFEVMTLQDALVAHGTYARAEGKSPKTISWITSSVGYFADFLGPECQDIASVSGNDLCRFIIALQERRSFSNHPYTRPQQAKLSPLSIQTYCRAIRAFFGFLHRWGFAESNPMEKVKMPRVPDIAIPTLSEKDIGRLLDQPDKHSNVGFRDYAILLTLVDTGIRRAELAGLRAADIGYEQNLFRVMGKGSRQRYVPFGRQVAKALMRYQLKHRPGPEGTDNFWLRRDGQPLSGKRVERIVTLCGEKAGLRHCYPHKLRHTSSVLLLRNGGDVFSLQRKLGHRSLLMTRRYANLADSDVRDQHLRYGVADRLRL